MSSPHDDGHRHRTGSDSNRSEDTRGAARDAVDAQHERFGGINWGAGFFGWLSANGFAVLLLALLSAAGVAIGLTQDLPAGNQAVNQATEQAGTIGVAGGVAVLLLLFIAYLAGGYVAGRMSRFDGAKQGLAVWLIGLIVVVLIAIAAAVLGSQYDVLGQLNLPRIPIDSGTLTTGGLIALVAAALVTLAGAVLGGLLGNRYHRKVDRAGLDAV
ncbi:MAG: hypothetical protein H0T85_03680 [Geodermatophilaceae bacterium]|nr:hypothetical protein [Geodermatophilaceae bacterium]